VGVFKGDGAHTREEWIEKESLITGAEVGLRYLLALVND